MATKKKTNSTLGADGKLKTYAEWSGNTEIVNNTPYVPTGVKLAEPRISEYRDRNERRNKAHNGLVNLVNTYNTGVINAYNSGRYKKEEWEKQYNDIMDYIDKYGYDMGHENIARLKTQTKQLHDMLNAPQVQASPKIAPYSEDYLKRNNQFTNTQQKAINNISQGKSEYKPYADVTNAPLQRNKELREWAYLIGTGMINTNQLTDSQLNAFNKIFQNDKAHREYGNKATQNWARDMTEGESAEQTIANQAQAAQEMEWKIRQETGNLFGDLTPEEVDMIAKASTEAGAKKKEGLSPLADPNLYKYALDKITYQQERNAFHDKYQKLLDNADFAEKSRANEKEYGWTERVPSNAGANAFSSATPLTPEEEARMRYSAINGNRDAVNYLWDNVARPGMESDKTSYPPEMFMTSDEVAKYNYLYAKDSTHQQAEEYFQGLLPDLNKRSWEAYQKDVDEMLNDPGAAVLANLAGTFLKPYVGLATLGSQIYDVAAGNKIDPYEGYNWGSNALSSIREKTAERISEAAGGEWGGLGFNASMSVVDNFYQMALASGVGHALGLTGKVFDKVVKGTTLFLMGTDSAQASLINNLERGVPQDRAVILGLASGLIEVVTEKIGLDELFKAAWKGKGFLIDLIKQGLAEGGEEVASDILNMAVDRIYDLIAGQNQSEIRQRVYGYMAEQGWGPENEGKALAHIMDEKALEVLESGATGFVSGVGMGGIYGGANVVRNDLGTRSIGSRVSQEYGLKNDADTLNALLEEGLDLPETSDAHKQAQIIQNRLDAGKSVSDRQFNKLYGTLVQAQPFESAPQTNDVKGRSYTVNTPAVNRIANESWNTTPEENAMRANAVAEAANLYRNQGRTAMASTIEGMYVPGMVASEYLADMNAVYEARVKGNQIPQTSHLTDAMIEAAQNAAFIDATKTGKQSIAQNGASLNEQTQGTPVNLRNTISPSSGILLDRVIDNVKNNGGTEAAARDVFSKIYIAGFVGSAYEQTSDVMQIPENIRAEISEAAAKDNEKYIKALTQSGIVKADNKSSGVATTAALTEALKDGTVSQNTVDISDKLGKMLGVTIAFISEDSRYNGNIWNKKGIISINLQNEFFKGKGIDAAIFGTLGHEITHRLQQISPNAYSQLSKMISGAIGMGGSDGFVNRVLHQMELQPGISPAQAIDEVISDYVGSEIFKDTAFADKLLDNIKVDTAEKKSLVQKLKDLVHKILNFIRGNRKDFPEGSEVERRMQAIEDKLADLIRESANTITTVDNIVDNSDVELLRAGEHAAEAHTPEEEVLHSLKYKDDLFDRVAKKNLETGYIDEQVLNTAKEAMDETAKLLSDPDIMKYIPDESEVLSGMTDANGKKLTTLFGNASYGWSAENSSVCVRSLSMEGLLDLVAEKLGHSLTVKEAIAVSQLAWAYTDQPTCQYCYVWADRLAERAARNTYIELRDKALRQIGTLKKSDAIVTADDLITPKVKKDGSINDRKFILKDAIAAHPELEAQLRVYKDFLGKRDNTINQRERFARFLKNARDGLSMVQAADVVSEAAMAKALANDPHLADEMADIQRYASNASHAKSKVTYTAYNSDILNLPQAQIDMMNSEYGIRFYSYSDFHPAFILENMQMFTDAAARGLKGLAYTKDLDYARIFAKTGANINISIKAIDGTTEMDGMQGADWEGAKKLRDKYKNVGTVLVATSDMQVEWALSQDWIDVVIPYHVVFSDEVGKFFGWKNYKAIQDDKKIRGQWNKDTDVKHIAPPQHQNNKDLYLQLCKDNHLKPRFSKWIDNPNYMKLVNETRQSEGMTQKLQPVFDTSYVKKCLDDMVKRGGYNNPFGGSIENLQDFAEEMSNVIRNADETTYERIKKGETLEQIQTQNGSQDIRYSVRDTDGNTLTRAQQEYFEDSKVRDQDGNLQIVYHGSPAMDITQFDRSKAGAHSSVYTDQAIWFTNDPKFADDFSYQFKEGSSAVTYTRGQKGKVYSGYLNITNPFDLTNPTEEVRQYLYDNADQATVDRLLDIGNHQLLKQYIDYQEIESLGYDGIIAKTSVKGNTLEYGVFNSNQYKNADNQNPTKNPDIRRSIKDNSSDVDFRDAIERNTQREQIRAELNNTSEWRQNRTELDSRQLRKSTEAMLKNYGDKLTVDQKEQIVKDVKDLAYSIIRDNKNIYDAEYEAADIASSILFKTARVNDAEASIEMLADDQAEQAIDYLSNYILSSIINTHTQNTVSALREVQNQIDRNDKLKETLRQVRQRRDENIRRGIESRKAQRLAKTDSKLREEILKRAKRLNNMKMSKPNQDLREELIGGMNTDVTHLTDGDVKKVENLRAWIAEKEASQDENFYVSDSIKKKLDIVNHDYIDDLIKRDDPDAINKLRTLNEALLELEHMVRTQNQILTDLDKKDVRETATAEAENIRHTTGTKEGIFRKMDSLIIQGTLSPMRFWHRLTGYNEKSALYKLAQAIDEGGIKKTDFEMRASKKFDKWMSDKKLTKKWVGRKADVITYETVTATGEKATVQLTPGMRMTLYLASQDGDWMRHMCGYDTPDGHISGGGITLPNMEIYKKGGNAYDGASNVRITKGFLNKMIADMTAEERAFADEVKDFFNGMQKDELNAVSQILTGVDMAKEDDYLPISVDDRFLGTDYGAIKKDGTVTGAGAFKDRTDSGKPVVIHDLTDILVKSINTASSYIGYAVPIRDMNKIMGASLGYFDKNGNYQAHEETLRLAISQKWGDTALKYIDKALSDIQNPVSVEEDLEKAFRKMRSNYARSVLTLNLSVGLKQGASYPTAAAVVGYGPLAKALADRGKIDIDLIRKYTPLLAYRAKGFVNPELGSIKGQNDFWNNLPKGLNWITGIDFLTTRKLWRAAEYYIRDNQPGLYKKGNGIYGQTDAYYEEVAKIYNRIIEETQPNYTPWQRPQYLRSHSGIVQTLMMFKTQPMQNFNVLYDAIGNYRAKERAVKISNNKETQAQLKEARTNLRHAITSQIGQLVTFAAMTMMWNIFRRKKEKYTDEEGNFSVNVMLENMGKDVGSGIFGMIPFGSDAWSLISSLTFGDRYYGFESVTDSVLGDLGDSVKAAWDTIGKIIESDGPFDLTTYKGKIKTVATTISKLFGVPAENIWNMITALYKRGRDIFNDPYTADVYALAWDVDPAKNKKDFVEIAYRAYANGDMEPYEALVSMFIEEFGFEEDYVDETMRKLYAAQFAEDPGDTSLYNAYQHLYDLYKSDEKAFEAEYAKMEEIGFSEDQIKKGIENCMKIEAGVDSVSDLEERFVTPEAKAQREEQLAPLYGSSVYKSASDADKAALEGYAEKLFGSESSEWTRAREAIDNGVMSMDEYLKFRMKLDAADQPTDSGKLGTYNKDEQLAAIKAMGWSDAQAKKYWEYLPNDSKNPYDEGAKTKTQKKTYSNTTAKTNADIKKIGDEWNSLVNGNVDYNKRPLLTSRDMVAAGWEEAADSPDSAFTTYTQGYNTNDFDVKTNTPISFEITPILESGKVLSPDALEDYIMTLDMEHGVQALLKSDSKKIICHAVEQSEWDEKYWSKLNDKLFDIKDRYEDARYEDSGSSSTKKEQPAQIINPVSVTDVTEHKYAKTSSSEDIKQYQKDIDEKKAKEEEERKAKMIHETVSTPNSSWVGSVGYDEETGTLTMTTKGGRTYTRTGVSKDLYEMMKQDPGRTWNAYFK